MLASIFTFSIVAFLLRTQAIKKIDKLEEQVGKEHQPRKTADIFLLNLQSSRQEAVRSVSVMKDLHRDISKHKTAVK